MMTFFTWLNDMTLVIADPVLNWLLLLPRDAALIILAVATSFFMTIIRRWTTDQDLLKRCDNDKKRLKQLIKEAKKRKDKDAILRFRNSIKMIGMKCMSAELKPMLWALLPVAILGTWAFNRMAFHPPKADETVQVQGYFPVTDCGKLVHLLPHDSIEVVDTETGKGLIREIHKQELTPEQLKAGAKPDGVATWTIRAKASEIPHTLKIRHGNETYDMEVLVGQKTYSPNFVPFTQAGLIPSAELKLAEYRPFGFVPGFQALMCPAWLIGYMAMALVLVFVMKPVLRIH